jgi:RHS repeat-associated protein
MPYKRSVLRFMVPIPLGAMLALWLFGSSVAAQPPVATPTHCETVYAVHDEGTQHSQFFSYQLQTSTLAPLGPLHKRKDIEGLSVNPVTQVLYATSGKPNSILYVVDADTGEMSVVGDIGFDDVVGLAFHPDGSLWGWANQGLLEIDTDIGHGTLKVSENRPIYGLTWNTSGTTLYATANDQPNASTLWAYTADGWQVVCEGLPQKVEALETLPNDLLVYGFENDSQLGIHTLDLETCQTLDNARIETPYYDIEGIAWPTQACPPSNLEALRTYFESVEAEDIIINHDGAISVLLNDERFYGQLAEEIEKTTPPSDGVLVFTPIEDANADDQDDYLITYPNGDQQILYYLGNGETPEPFEFTNVEYAVADTDYTSNTITIKGLMTESTAIVSGDLKTSLIKNGVDTGLTSITVVNGDTLAVKTHSGSASRTRSSFMKRITLSIGKSSKQWTVKTPPPIKSLPETSGVKTGETAGFDVNQSGAVAYQIPIAVAPGTAGMQPKLSFTYSNHGNNGPLGVGFSLSGLSAITRCKTTLAQDGLIDGVDFDGNDKFCLDGERLIAIQGNYGAEGTEYRTEHTNFSKIQSFGVAGDGPAKFKVWTKAGLIMEYGYTENARIEAQGKSNVLFWYLNQIQDTKGNYLTFSYHENNALGESYPIRIDYTGNSNAGLTPYNSVQLIYEDRPDITPQYVGGSLVSMSQRLVAVKTYEKDKLFREYKLRYKNTESTQRSQLISVNECGSDGTCFEPTLFEWQTGANGTFQEFVDTPSGGFFVADTSGRDIGNFADVNGDGNTDYVVVWSDKNAHRHLATYLSKGDGTFHEAIDTKSLAGIYVADKSGRDIGNFADVNGDGNTDYVVVWSDKNAHRHLATYLSKGDGTFHELIDTQTGGFFVADTSGRDIGNFADVNGDGNTDYVVVWSDKNAHRHLASYLSKGDGTFQEAIDTKSLAGIFFADKSGRDIGQFADVNGDGNTDYVVIWRKGDYRHLATYLSKGDGSFYELIDTPNLGFFAADSSGRDIGNFADVNGDGNLDYVVIWSDIDNHRHLSTSLSKGDGTFQAFIDTKSMGFFVADKSGRDIGNFADVNGDGKTDYVVVWGDGHHRHLSTYLSKGDGTFQEAIDTKSLAGIFWADESGRDIGNFAEVTGDGNTDYVVIWKKGKARHLATYVAQPFNSNFLSTITNAHGAKIELDYKPLTDNSIYTKDKDAVYPERDFQGPIYVVSSYKTSNGIGGQNEITFRYGGAKLDSHGRGFRGFRWVEKTDQQTGLRVTSYYDQDHRYTGSPLLKQEQRLADGTLLSETHNSLAFNDQGGIFSAYVKSSQTTSYDLDGSHIATVTTKQDYDDYGNLTQATTTHDDGYTQTTTNTYLNDTANWFLGRLTNTVVSKQVVGQAAQTRTSAFEYDPDSGLLTKEIIEPNHASLRLEKSYQHDAYGNIIQSTTSGPDIDARSHFTRYDQDGRFVIESQNALGHTESKRYQMGNLVALTGPNKLTTTWFYDSFGRKMLEKRADGTETQTAYLLCEDSCPASATYYRKTTTSGAAPTQVYYDHLDRVVRETTLGFDNRPIHVDTQYDERGQIKRVSEPYFEKESPVWTVNEYDILGRVIKQTAPDNSITTTRYEGFTTVVTNPLGQTQTRTVNSRQQMIESLDHFNHSLTYIYDGFGKLLELRDPMGNVTEIAYDQRGNKIKMIDPDTGTSRYQYNALGELVAQTDAKGQTVQMRYDQLGRLIWRQEPEGLSTWTYDTRPKGIGKLAQLTGPNGYQELYTYGHFGRLTETLTTIGEQHYPISKTYDQYGRVDSLTYPTGFAVRNLYDNAKGYLLEVQRASDHHVYWRAEQRNARGQLEQVSLGNGLVTQSVYDKLTGRIQAIETSDLQNLQFSFDRLGNLTQRRKDNLVENFRYDALNRLIQTSVEGGQNTHIGYDALGNITYKSDVGNYSYGSRPHAVTAVSGHLNQAYRYDANGNRLSSTTGTVAYTSFNKPHTITEGHTTLQFLYGPNYSRYQKTVIKDSVTESVKTYIGGLYEQAISDTLTKDIHYIFAGSDSIAIETQSSDGNHSTRYLHKDHLGSIEAITDEQGALVESFSFDAWGKRRAANWNALSEEALRNLIQEGFQTTSRGFTGHEHLDEVQLIHMNGRVYDPVIGRFISADPIVQAPANLQNLNRYSYVLNNPLSLVDPSGFIFKKLFKGIKKFLKKFKKEFIFLIGVATAGLASWAIGTLAGQVGAVTSAIVSGAGFNFGTSFAGTLAYGGNLKDAFRAGFKAGFIGGISAGLSQWVNTAFKNNFLPRAIGRSVVNGAANVMSGGSFKDGFRQSFVNDALNVGYKKLVGAPPSLLARQEGQTEDTALRSSEPQVGFNNSDKPILGAKSSLNKWVARNIPLFNAIAIAHDKMLDVLGASPNTASKFFLNIPTMPIALAATPGAYMSQISVTYQFPNRAK